MFILEKVSTPGWEFRSNYIEQIYSQLDAHVCDSCKLTEQVGAEYEDDGHDFKPETFSQWSSLEQVEWLLGTLCGCEFHFGED
jgi:hypothetical protein